MSARLSLDCIISVWDQCDARTASSLLIAVPSLARALWDELESQDVLFAIKGSKSFHSKNLEISMFMMTNWSSGNCIALKLDLEKINIGADKITYIDGSMDRISISDKFIHLEVKGILFSQYIRALMRIIKYCTCCDGVLHQIAQCDICSPTMRSTCIDCSSKCDTCNKVSCSDCYDVMKCITCPAQSCTHCIDATGFETCARCDNTWYCAKCFRDDGCFGCIP